MPNLTLVRNEFSALGQAYRKVFLAENGSMFNALALQAGLDAEPGFEWAFIAHNDSAPLSLAWNEEFFRAAGDGLVAETFAIPPAFTPLTRAERSFNSRNSFAGAARCGHGIASGRWCGM